MIILSPAVTITRLAKLDCFAPEAPDISLAEKVNNPAGAEKIMEFTGTTNETFLGDGVYRDRFIYCQGRSAGELLSLSGLACFP